MGLMIILIGLDIIKTEETSIHSPRYIIILGGLVFVGGGLLVLLKKPSILVHIVASLFYLSFSIILWWIAFFSPDHLFTKNSIFMSDELYIYTSRLIFGFIALLTSIILIYSWKKLVINRDKNNY